MIFDDRIKSDKFSFLIEIIKMQKLKQEQNTHSTRVRTMLHEKSMKLSNNIKINT